MLAATAAGTGIFVASGDVHPAAPAAPPCNPYLVYGKVWIVTNTGVRTAATNSVNLWVNWTSAEANVSGTSGGPEVWKAQVNAGQYQFDLPCNYANGEVLHLNASQNLEANLTATNTSTVASGPSLELDALLKAPALTASITAPASPDQGEAWLHVNFTATEHGGSGGYKEQWTFGDGSQSPNYAANNSWTHIYTTNGNYFATVTVTDSIGDTVTTAQVEIEVVPGPSITSFTAAPMVLNNSQQVTFTTAILNGATPYSVTYQWGIAQGTFTHSVGTSPDSVQHFYKGQVSATTGTQANVSLIDAKSKSAGPSSVTLWIYNVSAHTDLAIVAGVYTTDVGQPVLFNSTSAGGGGYYAFAWRFTDGYNAGTGAGLSHFRNPLHTFNASGTYTVEFWANDSSPAALGNSVLATVVVKVNPALLAGVATNYTATGNSVDLGQRIWVDGNSTSGGTTTGSSPAYSSYFLSYGDGNTQTVTAASGASHLYGAAGSYFAWVRVTDAAGVTNRTNGLLITVNNLPSATPTVENTSTRVATTEAYQGENLYFLASGVSGGTGALQYFFNFGDGSTSGAWGANSFAWHAYNTTAGSPFTVTLEIKDSAGGFVEFTTTVTVVAPLSFTSLADNLTAGGGEVSLSVKLTATIANGISTYTYSWYYGDGSTLFPAATAALSMSENHVYTSVAVITATVIVQDAQGERVLKTVSFDVVAALTATPSPTSGPNFEPPLNVTFSAGVAGGSGTISSYTWNLGNNNQSTGAGLASISTTYWHSGNYRVTVTMTDSFGDKGGGAYSFTVLGTNATYALSKGWNLISLPGIDTNYDLWFLWEDLLFAGANAATTGVAIQNTAGGMPYNYTFQNGIGPDAYAGEAIGNARGIWVDVAAAQPLGLSAVVPAGSVSGITLQAGWNNLGWVQSAGTTASGLVGMIPSATEVTVWNPATQAYTTYIVGFDSPGGTYDVPITMGEGVLVWVPSATSFSET